MTITTNDTRDEYTASAGQTVFNYTFKIFADTDLNVYQTPSGQTANDTTDLITAYTVTGVGATAGGTITLTTAASAGDLITIVSNIPDSRTTDYQYDGDFIPDVVNDDFDRVVSLVKQVNDRANRGLAFQESEQGSSGFTLPQPMAGYYVRWNGTLDGFENVPFTTTDPGAPSLTVATLANITDADTGDWRYVQGYSTVGDGGHGVWVLTSGNFTAELAADTLNGIYLEYSGEDGSTRAWVRQYEGSEVYPEWFGAVVDDETKGTVNYNAIRAALSWCLYTPIIKLEGWPTLRFRSGTYYITGNSPLALTRSEIEAMPSGYRYRRGVSYKGNGRSATVLKLLQDDSGDMWFYSNYDAAYPGAMSAMDNITFTDITFRGTVSTIEQATGSKTNGFYWESTGWEKFIQFKNCDFEYLDIGWDISGYGNADHNRWYGCHFYHIRDVVFSMNNNQSVANSFFGCDAENIMGDVFLIGEQGGGDVTWVSGSIVLNPEFEDVEVVKTTQREKAFLSWDNSGVTSGPSSGVSNGKFRFSGLRFEIYDASQHVVYLQRSDTTAYGSLEPTFEDCDFSNIWDYAGTRPSTPHEIIIIGNTAFVMLNRCSINQYSSYSITKFVSSLLFRDCIYENENPVPSPYTLLHAKCTSVDTGTISCIGLRTQKEVTLGSYSITSVPDFTIGYEYLPYIKKSFNAKHRLQGWPQQGLTGPSSVYLPAGSKVVSITLYKPAEAIASPITNYGLYVRDYASTAITASDVGSEDREVSVKWELDTPFVVPASPNNYIVLAADAVLSTTLFTDMSGMFLVEYF